MKTVSVPLEGLTLDRLIQEASGGDVVLLTDRGRARFALMPLDDGDEEIVRMRSNSALMAFLDNCARRAAKGPRKSLDEIRRTFKVPPSDESE
jgi:hypothetical protein